MVAGLEFTRTTSRPSSRSARHACVPYNRTKSIMGVSPNIYIQNERLRIAAKFLLEGEYNSGNCSASFR